MHRVSAANLEPLSATVKRAKQRTVFEVLVGADLTNRSDDRAYERANRQLAIKAAEQPGVHQGERAGTSAAPRSDLAAHPAPAKNTNR